jgi:hypothetical protein
LRLTIDPPASDCSCSTLRELVCLFSFASLLHLVVGADLPFMYLCGSVWNEDPYKTHTEGFHPPSTLIDVLKTVTLDEKTTVYLLSGRGKADLDKIGKQVPRLGLVYVATSFSSFLCVRVV